MDNTVLLGGWIAAGLTLFMYSSLYKDNPFYRFGEHLYLGVSVGYLIVLLIYKTFIPDLYRPVIDDGKYSLLIPTLLGLMLYTRFFPKVAWVSRITFAFIVGYGAGLGVPRTIAISVFPQLEKIIAPLAENKGISFNLFNDILIIIGVFSVLIYFLFSVEHKGLVRGVSRLGIYFVMVAFGGAFGFTVMGRMSLFIGRTYDLIDYAKPDYYYATFVLLALIILVLVFYEMYIKKEEKQQAT
jgi:hypothetical protein